MSRLRGHAQETRVCQSYRPVALLGLFVTVVYSTAVPRATNLKLTTAVKGHVAPPPAWPDAVQHFPRRGLPSLMDVAVAGLTLCAIAD